MQIHNCAQYTANLNSLATYSYLWLQLVQESKGLCFQSLLNARHNIYGRGVMDYALIYTTSLIIMFQLNCYVFVPMTTTCSGKQRPLFSVPAQCQA